MPHSPFAFSVLFTVTLPGLASNHDPPTSTSQVAGKPQVRATTTSLFLRQDLANFCSLQAGLKLTLLYLPPKQLGLQVCTELYNLQGCSRLPPTAEDTGLPQETLAPD
jgi:hypothetical protein